MNYLIRFARAFYGIAIAGIGIQQFIYAEFRPVILAYWPASISGVSIWAYVIGAALTIAGVVITLSKNARLVSFILGGFFLLLFVCSHVYYQELVSPNKFHLGSWTDALKELALSGGAFIIATTYTRQNSLANDNLLRVAGRIFFSTMLIAFGIDHLLYTEFVSTLVPNWIGAHTFWTYFGAVTLIGSGLCILLKIMIRLVGILAGIMLLVWVLILHIPRAVTDPNVAKGNEITSVFEALAFSGIAFAIAWIYRNKISTK